MRMFGKKLRSLSLGAALLLVPTGFAFSEGGDSSSDAADGFARVVEGSTAVMIRVPLNAQGAEDTNAAEMRVYTGQPVSGAQLEAAWQTGVDASTQPVLNRDSSTSVGRDGYYWGWNQWNNWGWQSAYYYNNYQPYYGYYGNYYNYYRPTYYNSYYSQPYYGYYGYRYYYYNRYW